MNQFLIDGAKMILQEKMGKTMKETNIKRTLRKCKRAAYTGYKEAKSQYKSLGKSLNLSSSVIEKTLIDINNSSCYVSEATEALSKQLSETRNLLQNESAMINEDIEDLRNDMSNFSITLFGQTMAGKSTLMEILTEGNGASIGKGSQRTTRDIRQYTWNNLKVTDVPGIGAFEGEEDEDIAFEAARKADLVVFLLSDNAPQPAEAECFSRVLELGKPIIGLINVKSSIREDENLKLTFRNIERAFDIERLETLKNQFFSFAKLEGEDWKDIPFVYAHLKAAYLSQNTEDSEVAQQLYKLSHIDDFKSLIVNEVETHGAYYREKSFLDVVSVATLEVYENILGQAYSNQILSRTINEKYQQLGNWIQKYERDSLAQIESAVSLIDSDLKMEIPGFVDEHYDDKNAGDAWNELLVEIKLNTRCEEIANSISQVADDRLRELARELENEMNYMVNSFSTSNMNIPKMHKLIDSKKAWGWGTVALSGSLTITSIALSIAGVTAATPVGWVAFAVGIIGAIGAFFFKSIGKKEEKAKKKLEEELLKTVQKICEQIDANLKEHLWNIVNERLHKQYNELVNIESLIINLSTTQKTLALNIQPNLFTQSTKVFESALKLIWGGKYAKRVIKSARIPGKYLLAYVDNDYEIPEKKLEKLTRLMQEELIFTNDISNAENMINAILGDSVKNITEYVDSYVVEMNESDMYKLSKIRILQQFFGKYFVVIKGE